VFRGDFAIKPPFTIGMLEPSALAGKSAIVFNSLLAITAANVTGVVNLWGPSL
jgi:hypothetical protein